MRAERPEVHRHSQLQQCFITHFGIFFSPRAVYLFLFWACLVLFCLGWGGRLAFFFFLSERFMECALSSRNSVWPSIHLLDYKCYLSKNTVVFNYLFNEAEQMAVRSHHPAWFKSFTSYVAHHNNVCNQLSQNSTLALSQILLLIWTVPTAGCLARLLYKFNICIVGNEHSLPLP